MPCPHRMQKFLRLNAADNVLVALETIDKGMLLEGGIGAIARVPRGHKAASRALMKGEAVTKFGQIIGFATKDIVARVTGCTSTMSTA